MGAVQDLRVTEARSTVGERGVGGRSRVAIEHVEPQVECGRFAIKRVAGETVRVEADVFADGHDQVACAVLFRRGGDREWARAEMEPLGNDRWRGEFRVPDVGRYQYTVEGWTDHLATWRADLKKRITAGEDIALQARIGANLIEGAARHAGSGEAHLLWTWAQNLRLETEATERVSIAMDEELFALARRFPDLRFAVRWTPELTVAVDRARAGFSAWYELFPRSCSPDVLQHGTLHDCAEQLGYVASMGFDVLYLPPIHPIGRSFRKGKNNSVMAAAGDVGSPWAIGAREGGHTAIHPELGTIEDFRRLVARARELGMEIALDLAYQCSADHPYVHDHPEWFLRRPDGRIQYAENPPKKYEDIYPFDFETEYWTELWEELKGVAIYWASEGVRIFRVDNPHTKAFPFWEWLIREIKERYPEVLFLAEAFTRPRLMERLAKLGFTQSYTYFAWRNAKQELTEYFEELTSPRVSEYLRANLWPNTPDILTAYLQTGGRSAFMVRLILAATLGANYGIYGPAFELCVAKPRDAGSEEYLDSEKYELKHWNTDDPASLRDLIARVNRIRRENRALQNDRSLKFHPTDNPQVICYSKTADDPANTIVVLVNLDPVWNQSGFVTLDFHALGLDGARLLEAQDLLTNETYLWRGARNYFELRPVSRPAHILRVIERSGA
jgi:starch synthase (maltosyl-transferring)